MSVREFSSERVRCVDYENRHKKIVFKKNEKHFTVVGNLAELLQKYFGSQVSVLSSHPLCRNCYTRYKKQFMSNSPEISQTCETEECNADIYIPNDEVVDALNVSISAVAPSISPLKRSGKIRSSRRKQYVRRKVEELETSFTQATSSKLCEVYSVDAPVSQRRDSDMCAQCDVWFQNLNSAISSATYSEKVQLLTLIPDSYSKQQLQKYIPSSSHYLISKARKIKKEKGIWACTDSYSGHPLQNDTLKVALEYYLSDDKDCSQQSPNKADVISVSENGERVKKVKRYMTRSVRESYILMKKENPSLKIGLTKFYSLRPKWVKCQPVKAVCACIYCTNLKLICFTLNSVTGKKYTEMDLMLLCLCLEPQDSCWLQECAVCPGAEEVTIEALNFQDNDNDDDITYALWEGGELLKKTVDPGKFVTDVRYWVMKGISHHHIRRIQRQAIAKVKSATSQNTDTLVLHFDFAVNWSVALQNEVQSYHWQTSQVSIFTCVTNFLGTSRCFAVVSDDLIHDSAHACCAVNMIIHEISSLGHTFPHYVYVSDGAASHFKNRFQIHELGQHCTGNNTRKWLFSATGHGKSACDGVGGLCKHFATKFNLQHEAVDAIRDAVGFVQALSNLLKNVTLLLLNKSTIEEFRLKKKREWSAVRAVVGIQSSHCWVASRSGTYIARTVLHTMHPISVCEMQRPQYTLEELVVGSFISCVYDNHWWVGQITSVSSELQDVTVSFMIPHGPVNAFKWPSTADECAVPVSKVLLLLDHPSPYANSARLHKFNEEQMKKTNELFSAMQC